MLEFKLLTLKYILQEKISSVRQQQELWIKFHPHGYHSQHFGAVCCTGYLGLN
jgi:hypothetical protein